MLAGLSEDGDLDEDGEDAGYDSTLLDVGDSSDDVWQHAAAPEVPESIRHMVGDLQKLFVSMIEEERRANSELRADLQELRTHMQEALRSQREASKAATESEKTLQAQVHGITKDLLEERDAAFRREAIAEERERQMEASLEAAKEAVGALPHELRLLQHEVEVLTETAGRSLVEETAELRDTVAASKRKKEDLEAELRHAELGRNTLQADVKAETVRNDALAKSLASAERANAVLKGQRAMIEGEVGRLAEQASVAKASFEVLREKAAGVQSRRDELGATVTRLHSSNAALGKELEEHESRQAQLEECLNDLHGETAALRQQRQAAADEARGVTDLLAVSQAEKAALADERYALQSIVGMLQAEEAALASSLAAAEREAARLKDEALGTQGLLAELQEEHTLADKQRQTLQQKVQAADDENASLQHALARRDKAVHMGERKVSEASAVNSELQGQAAHQSAHLERLSAATARAESGAGALAEESERLQGEARHMRERVRDAGVANDELRQHIQVAQHENSELSRKVAARKEDRARLLRKVAEIREETARLQERAASMQGEKIGLSAVLEANINGLRKKHSDMSARLLERQENFMRQLEGVVGSEEERQRTITELGEQLGLEGVLPIGNADAIQSQLSNELVRASGENRQLMQELAELTDILEDLQPPSCMKQPLPAVDWRSERNELAAIPQRGCDSVAWRFGPVRRAAEWAKARLLGSRACKESAWEQQALEAFE